jgi:hypothetical protein
MRGTAAGVNTFRVYLEFFVRALAAIARRQMRRHGWRHGW